MLRQGAREEGKFAIFRPQQFQQYVRISTSQFLEAVKGRATRKCKETCRRDQRPAGSLPLFGRGWLQWGHVNLIDLEEGRASHPVERHDGGCDGIHFCGLAKLVEDSLIILLFIFNKINYLQSFLI